MKRPIILILTALLAVASLSAKSPKRGVCIDFKTFSRLEAMELVAPGTTWYYCWSPTPSMNADYHTFKGMEFVPMVWNAMSDATAQTIRDWCKDHPETKYLLGYNEPNFNSQAHMTPSEAAENWPKVRALANELGLKLVAPALNYSPDAPYTDPLKWMDEFVALVGLDAFDYTAVHSYGGVGITQTISTNFYEKYGKPVWITEFCYWPGNTGTLTQEQQTSFMQPMLAWMESTPWVFRYSWFMLAGRNNANFALVEGRYNSETITLEGYDLTSPGLYYVHLPYYDPDLVLAADTWTPVNRCVRYYNVKWSTPVAGTAIDAPLSVVNCPVKSTLDYNVNVPSAGNYTIQLQVGGYGEPTRFDPKFNIEMVDADGNTTSTLYTGEAFSLPNNDTDTKVVKCSVALPAGKSTIRLYFTSGSGIVLHNIAIGDNVHSGIADVEALDTRAVDVYNMQGVKLRSNVSRAEAAQGLIPGLYIIGTEKVLVR